jgi:hypothetical protein
MGNMQLAIYLIPGTPIILPLRLFSISFFVFCFKNYATWVQGNKKRL